MTTLSEIYNYYKVRVQEIVEFARNGRGDLWTFLMACSYIDFLVKMVYNKESNASHYKNFIKDYLSQINSQYKDFTYTNGGKTDLPEQMYYVLRCGLTHNYSLVPDTRSQRNGGRARSILLGQRKNGNIHFMKYDQKGYDTVIFTVEDFAEDLEKVLDKIFLEIAPKNPSLEKNILDWIAQYPPLLGKEI